MRFYSRVRLFTLILTVPASAFAAGEISFSLTTNGSFRNAPPWDISFQGSEFTGTTSGGSLALDNLGTFNLVRPDHGADPYHGDTFVLDVLLALPGGITGSASFVAPLTGTVNTQLGQVLVDFGPPQTFVLNDSSGSDSSGNDSSGGDSSGNGSSASGFQLTLNDVSLALPGPHSDVEIVSGILTGTISNTTDTPNIFNNKTSNAADQLSTLVLISNPEPLSIVLLGTVILLVVFNLRVRARTGVITSRQPL